jgi:cytochrome b6-f complex iron-sulfur subunit
MSQNATGIAQGSTPTGEVTRRGFLQWALGFSIIATIGGVLIPIIGYLWPPARQAAGSAGRVLVGAAKDLPVGQAKVLPVNDKPVIVVNTAKGGVKAFSAICTHLGCVVTWDQGKQVILCPCHDGRFNPMTGAVISGPPPAPLPPMRVAVENDQIFVGGA